MYVCVCVLCVCVCVYCTYLMAVSTPLMRRADEGEEGGGGGGAERRKKMTPDEGVAMVCF